MIIVCPQCGVSADKASGAVNRARAKEAPVYCSRQCAGLGRRDTRTDQQKRDDKADYDEAYRAKNRATLKAKKAAYYAENVDRDKEREARQKRMPKHVEYCRRPEYVAQKAVYDRRYRAEKDYGPFADAGLMLLQLQEEINNRSTWLERQAAKGTLNKPQQRKREYGKRSIKETVRREPEGRTVGHPSGDPSRPTSARRG